MSEVTVIVPNACEIVDPDNRNNGGHVVHRIEPGEYAVRTDGPKWSPYFVEVPSTVVRDVYVNSLGASRSTRVTEPLTAGVFRTASYRTADDAVAAIVREVSR